MNPGDVATVVALVLAFAVLVTVHLAIVLGLLGRAPRWRSLVALVVAPLAPYWAFRAGMYVRAVAWVVSGVAYAVARVLAA
jgi:hypothetical protein